MNGVAVVELKLLGPVQLHVTPDEPDEAVKLSVSPVHTGPLYDAVKFAGRGFTTMVTVSLDTQLPLPAYKT